MTRETLLARFALRALLPLRNLHDGTAPAVRALIRMHIAAAHGRTA